MHCPICKQSFGKDVKRCPLHGARLAELPETERPTLRDEHDFGEDPTVHIGLVRDRTIGRQFKDRFVADEQIGEGTMGRVYRGRDLSKKPHELVAIKVLKAQETDELGIEARFKREAMLVSKLDHPNTIRFVEWGSEEDGTLFLVTELLAGEPLDKLLAAQPTGLGEERTLEIVDQVAASLADAHAHGVVHRDIKPANIFVDGNKAKLLDFGIARIAFNKLELSKTFAQKTSAGMAMFTPMYSSPEQAVGDELDHRADLYSLGVVAYHTLTGKTPFKGGLAGLIEAHLSKEPPPIAERAPGTKVNYATEKLIRKMMAKRPADRPQTADAIRAEVAEIRGDTRPTKLDLPQANAAVAEDPAVVVVVPAAVSHAEEVPSSFLGRWWLPILIGTALLIFSFLMMNR